MASITLAEASKLGLNDLAAGVAENIITVNPIYNRMPFQDINGNALAYNRENALGDSQALDVGGTITAKAQATYTPVTTTLKTLIGDAEIDGLLEAQNVGGNAGNDLVAAQIASKAKSVGRKFQDLMITGDTANPGEFDGLAKIFQGTSQEVTLSGALTFEALDELCHKVTAKDGQIDYLLMPERTIRALRTLSRALGGTTADYVDAYGMVMPSYAGIPIYRNDWIPTNIDNSLGTGSLTDSFVFAGCFDDGSRNVGMSGLTSAANMGMHVEAVGAKETADSKIWRVKFYAGLAVYSLLSGAILTEVAN